MRGDRRLAHLVQSHRRATVAQIAEKVNAGYDRQVSEHTVHCSLLRMGQCSPYCTYTANSAKNGHVNIRNVPWSNGRRWPTLMNHVFFCILWMAGCLYVVTWGRDSTRMHYRKKASLQRQGDALGNVLLGNLGYWHSCGCNGIP